MNNHKLDKLNKLNKLDHKLNLEKLLLMKAYAETFIRSVFL